MRSFGIIFYCALLSGLSCLYTNTEEPTSTIRLGILQDEFPRQPSHADPRELSVFLQNEGYTVSFLSADQLADETALRSDPMDILILPYGATFPFAARNSFISYLKNGGAFVSMGGYAFDDLVVKRGNQWERLDTIPPDHSISGRRGKPGDWMRLQAEQIPIFDPTYPFKRTHTLGSDTQSPLLLDAWSENGTFDGFPATAMTGSNNPVFPKQYGRWYPLVTAYDRYGKSRGSVFSLVLHHDGPYKGSAWAFSGVTNENLFSNAHPRMLQTLSAAIRAIHLRTFLISTVTETDEHGVSTLVSTLANYGKNQQSVALESWIGKNALAKETVSLSRGNVNVIRHAIPHELLHNGYIPIHVSVAAGQFRDSIEHGFYQPADNDDALDDFTFQNNYMRINGKPTFLFGTNQTGMVWFSAKENPATWERDLVRMRDHGLRMLRVLHFSPYAARGYEGHGGHSSMDLAGNPPARLIRQTDDLVAMCARNGVALMLTLHDWLPVTLSDPELDAQKKWARFWADRYHGQTHVFFDIQNEPSVQPDDTADTRNRWNEFLKNRYANDSALHEAWGAFAPVEPLGEIPCNPGPDVWENPRQVDYNRFRAHLLERWIDENMNGIREGSSVIPASVGFLQSHGSAEKLFATSRLDFCNSHYHGPIEPFASITKLIDRRFRGQGFAVGEFGAWDAHEARSHGRFADETTASIRHFLAVGHDTFGMGGCFALNWDWKDFDDCLFPWGLSYAQDYVPKDWLTAYRNMSLFFRAFQPVYEDPGIYLLIPDSHRLGGQSDRVYAAIDNAIHLLFACHIDFNVINEKSLDDLPNVARTIFWPIPYCPADAVFEKVLAFVRKGGNLYFSGDLSFDEWRRPSRTSRFKKFGLPLAQGASPFQTTIPRAIPDFIVRKVGEGQVCYLPAPIEWKPLAEWEGNPYAEFLTRVEESGIFVEPNDPRLHLFSIPETNKNLIYTLFRCEKDENLREYRIQTPGGEVSLALAGFQTGLIETNREGALFALEGTGFCRGRDLCVEILGHAMLQSLDGFPLEQSQFFSIYPTQAGTIRFRSETIRNPWLVIGEMRKGQWIPFEELEPEYDKGTIQIDIDEDRAACIVLCMEKARKPEAVQALTSLVKKGNSNYGQIR
ncbi:MAG: hypothetical protein C4527_27275 [Candidatus Omnitrophota bacterium]|jgi:hypothetical protein|nr:MAG: hypothetical protein C4527_27275 [Candidatus Omnitrophota bacterium]